jgi:diaminohydroxyphosphoribosylaminopyrimidine deaminase/5-amino-6-(5-phosphoribosylamino)uracil reductase
MTSIEAMKRALLLAMKGAGKVYSNPLVGAVILKDGQLVSEGWHEEFGGKHAEINAIDKAAGVDLSGATLVVNLEPCVHFGKTPPCAPAIIEKKFAKVVIGMEDPNPLVSGKGVQMLREAGIEVEVGVLEEDCHWVNRAFIYHITNEMPYIILKVAQSFDGCIATSEGASRWISSPESRKLSHKLRAETDAVLIGRGTALADNPRLDVRVVEGRNPKKIVLDSTLSLPLNLNIFNNPSETDVFVACTFEAALSIQAEEFKNAGIKIVPVQKNTDNSLDLSSLLKILYKEHKISSILVEGGSSVFSSFAGQHLINELHIFTAPIIIGNGKHSFDNFSILALSEALKFKIKAVAKSGVDIYSVLVS